MTIRPTYEELELRIDQLEDEALKHKNNEYKLKLILAAVEQSIEGIAISDLEGNLLFVNNALAAMHGYTRQELIGRNLSIFHTSEQIPALKKSYRGFRETGKFSGEIWRHHRFQGEFLTYVQNSILRDEEGNPVGMIGTVFDITERKRVENLARIQSGLGVAISMAVDLDDVMRFCLDASLQCAGLDCGGIYLADNSIGEISLAHHQGLPPTFIEGASHFCADTPQARLVFAGKPVYYSHGEIVEFTKTTPGAHRLRATAVIPIKREGKVIGCLNVASHTVDNIPDSSRDALETIASQIGGAIATKKAEQEKTKLEIQLRQAQKMEAIGILAGGIAHDFNNLLSVVMGNASVMLFGMDPSDENYESLEDIVQAAKAASALTSHLLGFARKEGFKVKPISLNNLIRDSFEAFARTKKEIAVHQDLAEDLSAIEADENLLSQVLLNIFINASDAMPGGGDFYLKTMNTTHENLKAIHPHPKPGKYVLLSITDSGEGMDQETQEHIFEPFFSTKEKRQGAGLGLASVYGTIRSHGGYIAVDSEKGRGTTFTIYLPASEKEVQSPAEVQREVTKSSGTVLVVDDEKKVLEMAVKVLRKIGYTVFEASSGREAIEVYKANQDKIDLIILDIIMPEMGGGEVYDRMKEIDPEVVVLLSSGYNVDDEAKKILERGCDGFIQKPFTMQGLYLAIERVLEKT